MNKMLEKMNVPSGNVLGPYQWLFGGQENICYYLWNNHTAG